MSKISPGSCGTSPSPLPTPKPTLLGPSPHSQPPEATDPPPERPPGFPRCPCLAGVGPSAAHAVASLARDAASLPGATGAAAGAGQEPPGDTSPSTWGRGRLSSGNHVRLGRQGCVPGPWPSSPGSDQLGPTQALYTVHPRCSQYSLPHPHHPWGPAQTAAPAEHPSLQPPPPRALIHLLAVLADLSLLAFVAGGSLKASGGRQVTAHPLWP